MTTGKRRRYNKATTIAARRAALIDAGYRTFVLHGLDDTTMARIGRAAGMSHGIVNYYFGTREDLLTHGRTRYRLVAPANRTTRPRPRKDWRPRVRVTRRTGKRRPRQARRDHVESELNEAPGLVPGLSFGGRRDTPDSARALSDGRDERTMAGEPALTARIRSGLVLAIWST